VPRDRNAIAQELLTLRCQQGDRTAWEELVRTWDGRLYYFIRRLIRHDADAFDVLQKTWLRILRGMPSLDDPQKLVPWLYRIARNTAYSHAKMQVSDQDSLSGHDNQFADPASIRSEFEDAEQVHRGLESLTVPHREVLTLAFLEDMSIEDIANVLGVPAGTVKSRLHYAKRALREAIEGPGAP
jgi:RNA polymerase sigma factor (sigma-70 family)